MTWKMIAGLSSHSTGTETKAHLYVGKGSHSVSDFKVDVSSHLLVRIILQLLAHRLQEDTHYLHISMPIVELNEVIKQTASHLIMTFNCSASFKMNSIMAWIASSAMMACL